MSGANPGDFVFPGELPDEYANLAHTGYSNYNWQSQQHVAVQFKKHPKRVAIFKSKHKANNVNLSWESVYFERLFSEQLMNNISYYVNEDSLVSGLDANTTLLVIPAVTVQDSNYTFYIDSIFSVTPDFKENMDKFLRNGGTVYAEGNAPYFLEKLGYLESGTFNYASTACKTGTISTVTADNSDLNSLGAGAAGNSLYGSKFPQINSTRVSEIVTDEDGTPVLFKIDPNFTLGGTVICNTGLPTVNGLANLYAEDQQISWTLNSILSAFSHEVDVTRRVRNEILHQGQLGNNCISYDRPDTLTVELTVRNLSDQQLTINLSEAIKEN